MERTKRQRSPETLANMRRYRRFEKVLNRDTKDENILALLADTLDQFHAVEQRAKIEGAPVRYGDNINQREPSAGYVAWCLRAPRISEQQINYWDFSREYRKGESSKFFAENTLSSAVGVQFKDGTTPGKTCVLRVSFTFRTFQDDLEHLANQ